MNRWPRRNHYLGLQGVHVPDAALIGFEGADYSIWVFRNDRQ